MAKSNEAVWWSLFAVGGVIAALLMPITIFLIGLAVPLGWIEETAFVALVRHPLTRLYLFLLISFPLFHAAHRLRMTLSDLGLKHQRGPLGVILYGIAIVGTVLAVIFLVGM